MWALVASLVPVIGARATRTMPQQTRTDAPAPPSVRSVLEPIRVIRDKYASFSAVAVDLARDEVIAGDENLFRILTYDRLADTPPEAPMTEPRRIIAGDRTGIEFVCGLHVDQRTGDIYAIHADTAAVMQVFTRDQQGNVPPVRELRTGSELRGRGLAVDDEHEELFVTSQHNSAVAVFRKQAAGDDAPLRVLQGDRTRLANPHGIALDRRNGLIFITNHGQVSSRAAAPGQVLLNRVLGQSLAVLGSGRFLPPSITVHRRLSSGDEPPVRIIEGPQTQLNWPSGLVVDERHGEVYVANDKGNAVLVFRADAAGDASPLRVLKGPATALSSPGGLFLDQKHDELWVSNYGTHTLTVYPRAAAGNTPPRRRIRSAPLGSEALMIGNPGALAYDTKREEILVPN
jgi:DNA-binding beta-propeller fold protein YncE